MLSGIDVLIFKSHSYRSASTSAADSKGVPVDVILQTAGWTNTITFTKFYKRDVGEETPQRIFANSVLGQLAPKR